MSQNKPDNEFHAKNCATRNLGVALIFVAICGWILYLNWRDLNKPYREPSLYALFLYILSIIVSYQMLQIFSCLREQLVIALNLLIGFRGVVMKIIPNVLIHLVFPLRLTFLVLWVFALLVSLTMIVSAASAPKTA